MNIGTGSVVEFVEGQRFICGVCVGQKGSRYHLITHLGREMNLARGRFIHVSPPGGLAGSREEQIQALQEIHRRRDELRQGLDLEELWELVHEEGVTWNVHTLAEIAFSGEVGPDHEAAMVRAAIEDGLHFKFKNGAIICNPPEAVERIRRQREAEARRLRRLAAGSAWLRGIWGLEESGDDVISDEDREYWVEALKWYCIHGDEAPEAQMVNMLFRQAGLDTITAPFHTLVKLGVWAEDENLELKRYGLEQGFSPEVEAQARQVADAPLDREGRMDLTELETFTIDAEESMDLDDALSFQQVEDGWEIGVHITDIGLLMPPGTPLFEEAVRRASTIYMPDQRVPMLPPILSEDSLSLLPGRERRAVSFLAVVDGEGRLIRSQVVRSVISVQRRYSYEEVDRLLSRGDERFTRFHGLLKALEARRMEAGALPLPVPELVIRVEEGRVEVALEQPGPSRFLVAEAMILANRIAAEFLRDRSIPALYRSQPEPRERLVTGLDDDLVVYLRQRRRISRGLLDTQPAFHSGLGLEAYTTVTSPLRRGLDLLMQQQIAGFLSSGHPVHSAEELEQLSLLLKEGLRIVTDCRFKRQRYWLLKYMEPMRGERFKGWIIDEVGSRFLVALQDFMITVEVSKPQTTDLQLEDEVDLVLKKVDARENVLQFALEQ